MKYAESSPTSSPMHFTHGVRNVPVALAQMFYSRYFRRAWEAAYVASIIKDGCIKYDGIEYKVYMEPDAIEFMSEAKPHDRKLLSLSFRLPRASMDLTPVVYIWKYKYKD
jgi:hypothetical protein